MRQLRSWFVFNVRQKMKSHPVIVLTAICILQAAGIAYTLLSARVIWRKQTNAWIFSPSPEEVLIWRDAKSDAEVGLGYSNGEARFAVSKTEGRSMRTIVVSVHDGHLSVMNNFYGMDSTEKLLISDSNGDGIPERKVFRDGSLHERFVLDRLLWQEEPKPPEPTR